MHAVGFCLSVSLDARATFTQKLGLHLSSLPQAPGTAAQVIVDLKDSERILGMHYLGWNAGEVIQGFGIALKLKVVASLVAVV